VPDPTPSNPGIGSTWDWSDGSVMVYVPAGTFWMGSTYQDLERFDPNWDPGKIGGSEGWFTNELPQHEVYLDAFWVDRTEVTNAQYKRCVDSGTCGPPAKSSSYQHPSYYGNPELANYPVIHVDWVQAITYCTWAGKRLPTEAEWEKGARGTDKRSYPWGAMVSCTRANYLDCNNPITEVGQYPDGATPYGALDMAGNVREWIADWYHSDYYSVSPASNPGGPATGESRGVRGGSYVNAETLIRTAYRDSGAPSNEDGALGFRCAR
jgi:formylglycine-generating enzyme required for sulfatase activity